LRADGFGEFDFGAVEGGDISLGEVLEKAAQGDEVIVLGGFGEFVVRKRLWYG